jgi:hypothetical protein
MIPGRQFILSEAKDLAALQLKSQAPPDPSSLRSSG